jgi:hypothetical protein
VFESAIADRYGLDPEHGGSLPGAAGVTRRQVRRIAEQLAFCMAAEPHLGLSPPRDQLLMAMGRHSFATGAEVVAAMDLLQQVKLAWRRDIGQSDRASAAPSFAFVHRRFQEYFATCVVMREPWRVPPERLLTDGRWHETAVTLLQLQRGAQTGDLLVAAGRLLDAALRTLPYALPAGAGLPDAPRLEAHVAPFSWPPGMLHLLGVLDTGLAARPADLPEPLRDNAGRLLTTAFLTGGILDRKWALEVAGVAPQPVLVWLLQQGIGGRSDWLREVAATQVARLEHVPDAIADMMYASLCSAFLDGRLQRRRLAVDAELNRLQRPMPFLAVKDLLLALPTVDLGLGCLLMVLAVPSIGQGVLFFVAVHGLWYVSLRRGSWSATPLDDEFYSLHLIGTVFTGVLLFRTILGLALTEQAAWLFKPFLALVTVYAGVWAPAAFAAARLGWPAERRRWALLPFQAAAAIGAWLTRAGLARVPGWHDIARQVRTRFSVIELVVAWQRAKLQLRHMSPRRRVAVVLWPTLCVAIVLGLLLPSTRARTLGALALAAVTLVLFGLAKVTRSLLRWLLSVLLGSPRLFPVAVAALSRTLRSVAEALGALGLKLRKSDWWLQRLWWLLPDRYRIRRWLGSTTGEVTGRQLLEWVEDLHSPAGFDWLLYRLEADHLLTGRQDVVAALEDLTVIIDHLAARHDWPGLPYFRCPDTAAWLDRLGARGRKRLAALNGEHLDRAGQLLERIHARQSMGTEPPVK